MAGKGGGSWKVAYADFVTAMMAFFLVMWLVGQDQKVREAVANYFQDPTGASTKPGKLGAMFDQLATGAVPRSQSVALGKGRHSYTTRGEVSVATKQVSDWIHQDEKAKKRWKALATQARDAAPHSRDVRDGLTTADEAATRELAKQLRDEMTRGVTGKADGVYQDLLFGALADVNWAEIARDLLAQ